MREYFLELLNNLDTLAGLRQLEKIYAAAGDDRGAAITEINKLLTNLCNVSSMFPFIPEPEQQKIISQAVISEEFPNLNANVVYKWLNRHKDKYFKESQHIKQAEEKVVPPLTGEARQAKLKEWMASLAGFNDKHVPDATEQELSAEKRKERGNLEWLRGHTSSGYKPPSESDVRAHNLHLQWIKENFDPHTGKKKEGWISEDEWLKKQGK